MLNEIKTVLSKVEHILKVYPTTRSDDRALYYYYNQEFTKANTIANFIYNSPSFESIRRSRQRIQQEGKYLPVKAVADLREKEEYEVHKLFAV